MAVPGIIPVPYTAQADVLYSQPTALPGPALVQFVSWLFLGLTAL